MKRFFILLIFLLSLLSIITNGELNVGVQIANAQSMGSEITYYQCKKSSGQYYFSTEPCDYELPEVYICSCKYCHQQMSCDVITFHTCFAKSQYNNGSPYPPPYDNGSSSGGSNGSGGGANIPIGGGNSTTNTDPNNNRDSRDYDFGNAPWPKKTINEGIFNQNLNDLLKGTLNITQGSRGTCGAAALEKFLLDCYPQIFTEVAKSLYEVGHSHTWNLQLNSFNLTTEKCSELGYNTVDAIFQTVITQENNYVYTNFSLCDKSLNEEGTAYWKIKDFIQDHVGNKVETIDAPSYDQIKNALNDNSNIFLIGLVDSEKEDDNKNYSFGSSAYLAGNHFIKITAADGGGLYYYSWGGIHHSNNANICVLYIVKRK